MTTLTSIDLKRRNILASLAALPLAHILADPALAASASEAMEKVTLTTEKGQTISASLALPDTLPAPTVMLIHEWWGLRDEICAVAVELAKEGFIALAIDMYGGKLAETPEEAGSLMRNLDQVAAEETVTSWVDWLLQDPRSTGKVGTVGWCFGGGWSLTTSQLRPIDATVVYYGNVERSADDLKSLKGDVLSHFATRDTFIDREMVLGFESAMAEAGKTFTTHWYEADHAFANPTGRAYDEEDAALSWQRTLAFFKEKLS